MATFTVKHEGAVVREFDLPKGASLTLGRKETNDVVLESLVISSNHAKLDHLEEGYLLTDLKSKNGTFVNDQPITAHWLSPGEVIRLGQHFITFEPATLEEPEDDPLDRTMVLPEGAAPAPAAPAVAHTGLGVLSWLKGGEGEILLDKKLAKLGKAASNDVVVGGFFMGQVAATISRLPDGYHLAYVDGHVKPKRNGRTVAGSEKLAEFDIIELGSARLEFLLK